MAKLPRQLEWNVARDRWASTLDPILNNPINNVTIVSNVSLNNGVNNIPHKLGQVQQGWFLTDIQGAAQIYRSAPFNDKFLTLTSNAAVTVNIGVF